MTDPTLADPTYPLFPVLGTIFSILILIPLPSQIRARNVAVAGFIIWTFMYTICQVINNIMWEDNYDVKAIAWCTFSTRIVTAYDMAVACSSMCIQRRLYNVASIQVVSVTKKDKTINMIFDLFWMILVPLLYLVLHYCVTEGRNFDILEEFGCRSDFYLTVASIIAGEIPPILCFLVAFCYAGLTLRIFLLRRAHFMDLVSSNPSLKFHNYTRLMLMSVIELMTSLPLEFYGLYLLVCNPSDISPWYSWDYVHEDFMEVTAVPSTIWKLVPNLLVSLELTRWIAVWSCIIILVLFGSSKESWNIYRTWFWKAAGRFGLHQSESTTSFSTSSFDFGHIKGDMLQSSKGTGSLPVFFNTHGKTKNTTVYSTSVEDLSSSIDCENDHDASTDAKTSRPPSILEMDTMENFAPVRPSRSSDLVIDVV